jgi:hypothetical protein
LPTREQFGRIDVLMNNVSINPTGGGSVINVASFIATMGARVNALCRWARPGEPEEIAKAALCLGQRRLQLRHRQHLHGGLSAAGILDADSGRLSTYSSLRRSARGRLSKPAFRRAVPANCRKLEA